MNNSFSLENKTVLVTGASSGFGRAIAIAAAEAGADVILTARNEERLNETLSLLPSGNHQVISYDVNNIDGLDAFVAQLPKLDGLVLCAGIQKIAPVRFLSEDVLQDVMLTNTMAPIRMAQRLLKKNLIARGGSVVWISSIAATCAAAGNGVYAASKGALNAFAKCMALELAPLKIRVNCVLPGTVRTGATDPNMISEEDKKAEEAAYPLGVGQVEDIANGVLYLLSPASRWVTGAELTIDGGITLN